MEAVAHVRTASAERYVTQLCKHWSHKLPVELHDDRGVVKFGDAMATLEFGVEELVVTILADDEPTLERLQGVVANHLDRFAFREAPLAFRWQARS